MKGLLSGSDCDPEFAEVMDAFVRRADKRTAAELFHAITQEDLSPQETAAVWEAYDQCRTDEDKRAFVARFRRGGR